MSNRKRGRGYPDDDEIAKSIAEFQGQGVAPETEAAPSDEGEDSVEDAGEEEEEQGFGIMGRKSGINGRVMEGDRFDEESGGRGDDTDTIDLDAKKAPRVFKDVKIPMCSCCGAEWSVSNDGTIKNGCGCRIHPTCNDCEKCKGHCECQIQEVK